MVCRKFLFIVLIMSIPIIAAGQEKWTLQSCMDTAFKRNILLNHGLLSNQINKITLAQSKAAILPNLNLSDQQSLNAGYTSDPYTYQYSTQSISSNSLSLNSSVTLFNGYLLLNTIRQHKLLYEAGTLDIEVAKNTLLLNILAAFMQVLMDEEAIDETQAQIDATQHLVETTELFVRFGKVAELNLLQVQSQLATDKLSRITALNQLELDKIVLQQLMDVRATTSFDIERKALGDLIPEIPVPAEEIDGIAQAFLPDIKSAAIKTNASIVSLKMAEGGLLPKLTLTAFLKTGYSSSSSTYTESTSYQSETIGYVNNNTSQPVIALVPLTTTNYQNEPISSQLRNNFGQVVSLTLSVPLFNNLTAKSNVAIAKVNVQDARLNEQQSRNDVRKSIEIAYTNQVSAAKKLIATQAQADLEKRTYSDMGKKYALGLLSPTDYLIEKNNYSRVALSLVQAKYDYVLKVKMVDFYLGKTMTLN